MEMAMPVHPDTAMMSIDDLDAEIIQARDELTALRRQRNYLSATQRLPPEILVRILRLADDDDSWRRAGHGVYKVTRPLTWMAILHVSGRWREICMNFPGYWTSVPTFSIPWMRLALSRSGIAPIDLYYGGNEQDFTLASTEALENLPRVRSLRIEHPMFYSQDSWFLPRLMKHPAPMLEHFEYGPAGPRVRFTRLDYLYAHSLDITEIPLFQGVTPQLHSLVLSHIGIPPTSSLITPALRYLDINCIPRRWRWTYLQLRDVLERLPQLKDLRLLNSLPLCTSPSAITHPSSPLKLPPTLAHVGLSIERCQEAHDFFTYFVVPPTAFVDIDSECSHPHIEELLEDLEIEDVYPHIPEDDKPPHQRLIEALRLFTHGAGSDLPREGFPPIRHLHAEGSSNGMRFGLDELPCREVEFDCGKGTDYDPPPWDEDPECYVAHLVLDCYSPGPHPVNPEPAPFPSAQTVIQVPWLVLQLATELSGVVMDVGDEAAAVEHPGPHDNPLAHALGLIATSWSLDSLETVTIAGHHNALPLAVWCRLFKQCTRVRKVCIQGDAGVVALLCALIQGDGSGQFLLPALNLLAISVVDLREGSAGLRALQMLLSRRSIGQLNISGCAIDARTVVALRQSYTHGDIVWDRRTETSQFRHVLEDAPQTG